MSDKEIQQIGEQMKPQATITNIYIEDKLNVTRHDDGFTRIILGELTFMVKHKFVGTTKSDKIFVGLIPNWWYTTSIKGINLELTGKVIIKYYFDNKKK